MPIIRDSHGKFIKNVNRNVKCMDCNKPISYGHKRCKRCATSGKNNWSYGLTKETHSGLKSISIKAKIRQTGSNNSIYKHIYTDEERKKYSDDIKKRYTNGLKTWTYGKHIPFKVKLKSSLSQRNISIDEWDGFSKYKKYPKKFFDVRKLILKRDKHCCRICNNSTHPLHVHHTDENKRNNNLNNLITLCIYCHSKIHSDPSLFNILNN